MKPSVLLIFITIDTAKIPCYIEYKHVKNINLHVRGNETLYVSAPSSASQGQILSFLEKEQHFIRRTLQKIKNHRETHPPITLADGETLYVNGTACTLDWRLGLKNIMYRRGNTLFMETKSASPDEKRRIYHQFLFAQGKYIFPKSVQRVFPLLQDYHLTMPSFRQRLMKSRWGSCIPAKGIITLNTYLSIMPDTIIDHVVLHELCHLIQPNHSRHFYDIMTMAMPDWKERRQSMDTYMCCCI